MPTVAELAANPKMPDPFTFLDGTKVTSEADWVCRQKEISLLAQEFIYGKKPGEPESVEATYAGGTLNITVSDNGNSIEFSVPITTPSGAGPFPGMFNIGGSVPAGVASINYATAGTQLARSSGSQGRSAPSASS